MIVELRGINFKNKGAELMMNTVVQQVSNWHQENIVAVRPRTGTFKQKSQAGLYSLAWLDSKISFSPPLIDTLANLIPRKIRHLYGVTTYSEIDAILDASGFAYSEQWGLGLTKMMADEAKKGKRSGKKIILLPQAFGPFESPSLKNSFLQVLDNSDLIFARDKISYEHLINLGGKSSHIKIAPDFTNLVKGKVPDYLPHPFNQPCIIPSARMIDKTPAHIRQNYLFFLVTCTKELIRKKQEPFILVHDTGSDFELASQLQTEVGQAIKIINEPNPLLIKGILSQCSLVIASRFHGLISALSQGVPGLGLGWSHKYNQLFEDYCCSECLISSLDSEEEIQHKLSLITEEPSRSSIISRLQTASIQQKELSVNMSNEVRKCLESRSDLLFI
ncbi:hypothetical protein PCC7418_1873 [Halothece sp. PCC 7418]|uniref:polysaccharide pyruvyl transferase family protein n=1 Tax=Halothece sp. (strain PCC 7418) TaxID=65093 RepID=UPI0002A05B28|nr:polysaccharide pyruvyl transferase family protein [Halothece sp. PCC 7418]AFZ44041.1 hypothetical protein PCC7418_1873 [Halothece sp. PCC 7418]